MEHEFPQPFAQNYERLLKRLKLRGMQPKTIESYSHGVRRAGAHFENQIDNLSKDHPSSTVGPIKPSFFTMAP